jgi:hypothetical protein
MLDVHDHKGNRIAAPDPGTGEVVRIFDPRRQIWRDHFAWNADGDSIHGSTAIGRATVVALRLNRVEVVEARRSWVMAGWHPPTD